MESAEADGRVLLFAPIGRDGPAIAEFLRRAGVRAKVCRELIGLVEDLREGAAAVVLAEEGLFGRDLTSLTSWVSGQPPWSDLPFIILTSRHEEPAVAVWREKMIAELRNVALLERPLQTITLTSTVRAALRARQRQYEVRRLLLAQSRAAAELEGVVRARTAELETANGELHTQMAERARMEETLRQAQKIEAIGQLTGGVAHDFNNLLMVIAGGLEMLDRQSDPARRERLLDQMRQAAQRGAGLTRQLLAFSRRTALKPEPLDLAVHIGGMRELMDRTLRGDVKVEMNFADDLWPVEVDPSELELVALNLAVNARDAMPRGGTILIRARNSGGLHHHGLNGDFVRLEFIDDGVGMPPEVIERVFEPFFTTKDIGRGSGLGLAQVHGFATQSGGGVEIESQVGHGATISLLLPRSHGLPAPRTAHLVDLHAGVPRIVSIGSVLLVEDDDEVAALVTQMLEELGYDVVRAGSARAALGALANGRTIDLVFSDIMMPGGMNGVELAREVRSRRGDLPILLTSGYSEAARADAEAEGIRVLPKPYQLRDLAAALDTAMAVH